MDTSLISSLRIFYDHHATKFSGTRKRHRPEFDLIIDALPTDTSRDIIELGCGDGRLHETLMTGGVSIKSYVGIDFSAGLIAIAREQHPTAEWFVDDMIAGLSQRKDESADVIVAIASFQHLLSREQRERLLHECYRVLRYDGQLIMTNWSYSRWFLKRFWKQIASGVMKSLHDRYWMNNDMLIPWHNTEEDTTHYRYYHIFRLGELKKLCTQAGFVLDQAGFVDRDAQLSNQWTYARNTLIVAGKRVFLS